MNKAIKVGDLALCVRSLTYGTITHISNDDVEMISAIGRVIVTNINYISLIEKHDLDLVLSHAKAYYEYFNKCIIKIVKDMEKEERRHEAS